MKNINQIRSHKLNELNKQIVSKEVKLAGWVFRKRDHGKLLFIDLRDHYGYIQLAIEDEKLIAFANSINVESVIIIDGIVALRDEKSVNKNILNGDIEIRVLKIHLESESVLIPFQVDCDENINEELRLRYRFLALRMDKLHHNIITRCNVIKHIRQIMWDLGFNDFQTPILTSSSPEGARDFLVPSRLNPGKFYALPQAPQQFKQLLMISGFDRYFQIAPCFRDEDPRADRSAGDFYQLDVEMSFVNQEDVFAIAEHVFTSVFSKFTNKEISKTPFRRIKYDDAMLKYGCDKPDLRNPLIIEDVTDIFLESDFEIFKKIIKNSGIVRAIKLPNASELSRSFFDKKQELAKSLGLSGMAYIIISDEISGPIAKLLNKKNIDDLKQRTSAKNGDAIVLICEQEKIAIKAACEIRKALGKDLNLCSDTFEFCFIVDFPFFEEGDGGKIDFAHNPFSMPQGGLDALNNMDPFKIKAYQYDVVCNGYEITSGAIRNHKVDVMYKAFQLAGYCKEEVDSKFPSLINAFKFGAPAHGGFAAGIDRIVMLICDEPNIREVIAFPLNQRGEDLLMNAPNEASKKQLDELGIMTKKKN